MLLGAGLLIKTFALDRGVNAFSGLKVDSIPQADVYVDGKVVGKTPYENAKMTPGEYSLKLVVTGTTGSFFPWETKVKLVPESLTYVNRTLGETSSLSGHQIVWLEKLSDPNGKEIAVVSNPDGATIEVDGLDEGTAPKIITNVALGDHTIVISKTGYGDQVISGNVANGFRLNISVKLAKADDDLKLDDEKISSDSAKLASVSATPTKTASSSGGMATPYVLIEDTGLGFLRVRSEASSGSTEIGKVNVGEKFPLLSESSGWTEIKIGTSSGWVSDQYVQKFK